MIVKCKQCRSEVEVPMYFYDSQIISTTFFPGDRVSYDAVTKGKAICPICGYEINEYFRSPLTSREIVTLAVGKEIN
jgi:hypothetical protein